MQIGSLRLVSVVVSLALTAFAGCSGKDRSFASPGTGGAGGSGGGSGGTAGSDAGAGRGGASGATGTGGSAAGTAGTGGGGAGGSSGCDGGQCRECDPAASERRCLDTDTAQSCQPNGTWGGNVDCSGDTPVCRAETDRCGCAEGERRCTDPTHPELCQGGTWVAQAACAATLNHCLATTGECVDCVPGTEECGTGNVAQRCSESGSWVSLNACAGNTVNCSGCSLGTPCTSDTQCTTNACVNNKCATCKPGTKTCSGVTPRECSATGTWSNLADCAGDTPVCVSATGTCVCSPSAQKCLDNNTPQRCNNQNQWVNLTDCAGDTPVCIALTGTCGCSSGSHKCLDSDTPQSCNPQGQWTNDPDCRGDTPACINSTGVCGCALGSNRCVGDTSQTCNALGQWRPGVECKGVTPVCLTSSGECGLPPVVCSRQDPAGGFWHRPSASPSQTAYAGGTITPGEFVLSRTWGTEEVHNYSFGKMTLGTEGGFLFMRFVRLGSNSTGGQITTDAEYSGTFLMEPGANGAITLTHVCTAGTAPQFYDVMYQAASDRVVIRFPNREEVWTTTPQ
jgi:hypothetical protein